MRSNDCACCAGACCCYLGCASLSEIIRTRDTKALSICLVVTILIFVILGATLTSLGCSPDVEIAECIQEPVYFGRFNGISTNSVCCRYERVCHGNGNRNTDCDRRCMQYGCMTFDVKYRLYSDNMTTELPPDGLRTCFVESPKDTVYETYDAALRDANLLYNKTTPSKLVIVAKSECDFYGSVYGSKVAMYSIGVICNVLAALAFILLLYIGYTYFSSRLTSPVVPIYFK